MLDIHPFNLLTILGPTASGKTRLAVALASEMSGEIISADSRQVFRGMDIGSGKDLQEYGNVPYHLIDILDSGEEFSVFAFQRCFLDAFSNISGRGELPILCGGTGLYLDAVLRGYRMVKVPENGTLRSELEERSDEELAAILKRLKPEQHNSSDLRDRVRTVRAIEIAGYEREDDIGQDSLAHIRPLVIGIRWERAELRRRISERLSIRLENGMIQEVQRLHDEGVSWERLDYYGLEYRHLGAYLKGDINRNDMVQKLGSAIHDFAKRQENWFRKMEKNGIKINWVEGSADPLAEAREVIKKAAG
ncbi:MAG: tRNA (adenosine(37)-N6)-dimethylallyltransferase MiaA [Desulfuromonadaceae bacterium]|nr:tRNA (adenosine(37)-N6)-dimethylallyltransferase MiaA [Desulfuromonadaceae bacterium]